MPVTWIAAVETYGLGPVLGALGAVGLAIVIIILLVVVRRRRRASPISSKVNARPPQSTPGDLRRGLAKTRSGLLQRLLPILGRGHLDPEAVEGLEGVLLAADVGVQTTQLLIRQLQDTHGDAEASLKSRLEQAIVAILEGSRVGSKATSSWGGPPHVVMVVGVNGVGKTTSIGKLAARFVGEGRRTLLVAGDTFRAAAIEQLAVWADRSGAELVRHQHGGDPGAVAFDGLRAAVARKIDVVIIDTAGRLHTKSNLMDELRKVRRVIAREVDGAPHETLLVIDAVTGQNGLAQARAFREHLDITGVILTKLDGTARGGIVLAIAGELNLPIRFVGVGEGVEDLREFDPREFAAALLAPAEASGLP